MIINKQFTRFWAPINCLGKNWFARGEQQLHLYVREQTASTEPYAADRIDERCEATSWTMRQDTAHCQLTTITSLAGGVRPISVRLRCAPMSRCWLTIRFVKQENQNGGYDCGCQSQLMCVLVFTVLYNLKMNSTSNHLRAYVVAQLRRLIKRHFMKQKKLTGPQPVMKFPTHYGARRFITVFTAVLHLFYSEPDESSPRPHAIFPKHRF